MFNRIALSTTVAIFILTGFFLLAFPHPGAAQGQEIEPGCCQYGLEEGETACLETGGLCPRPPLGTSLDGFFPGETCNEDTGLCSGFSREVPTLSEWGLIAMAGVLGLVGFMVIRRRKAAV